jgi:hypothetical protein
MIDPLREELITPAEAARCDPRKADGRRARVRRVDRDRPRGPHGVRLESVRTPRRATSREAVARFFARLTEAPGDGTVVGPAGGPASRDARLVEVALDAPGL